jgi:hypothetical protein
MRLQQLQQSRATTLTGSLASISGIVVALIPDNVWDACSAAVQETGSPLFTGTLLIFGLALTVIGPSLATRPQGRRGEDYSPDEAS